MKKDNRHKEILKLKWNWDFGKVNTKITFIDGTVKTKSNTKRPPTNPSHDIAHFICGFHGNMDWDYEIEPNLIAENNAVFMECLLCDYSFFAFTGCSVVIEESAKRIRNHMKWFINDYYCIPKNLNIKFKKVYKNFLRKLDPNIAVQHFEEFYKVYTSELSTKGDVRDIKVSTKMNSSIDYRNKDLYNYLTSMKEYLLEYK